MTDLIPTRFRRVIPAGSTPGKVIRRLTVVMNGSPFHIEVDEACAAKCGHCERLEQECERLRDQLLRMEADLARARPRLFAQEVGA